MEQLGKPKIGKLLFLILFGWASWANSTTVLKNPNVYLDYANYTFFPVYKHFILGFFHEHIQPIVLTIAACQLLIAVSMLSKGRALQIGCIGGMLFLVCIAPLGVGAAFPSTLIMALGMYFLLKNSRLGLL